MTDDGTDLFDGHNEFPIGNILPLALEEVQLLFPNGNILSGGPPSRPEDSRSGIPLLQWPRMGGRQGAVAELYLILYFYQAL